MKSENIKILIDSCFIAKRITETMAELPKGIKPRHIHVIECIFTLSKSYKEVRVSDVSNALNITAPSVTKLINELDEKKVIEKYSMGDDKRVTLLRLTQLGKKYYSKYVEKYHLLWVEQLSDITDEQVEIVSLVISKLRKAMPKGDLDE